MVLQVIYTLSRGKHRVSNGRRDWPLMAYTILMFALGTVFMATELQSLRAMFVDNREYPGGPMSYRLAQYTKPIMIVNNISGVLSGWLADGLLVSIHPLTQGNISH